MPLSLPTKHWFLNLLRGNQNRKPNQRKIQRKLIPNLQLTFPRVNLLWILLSLPPRLRRNQLRPLVFMEKMDIEVGVNGCYGTPLCKNGEWSPNLRYELYEIRRGHSTFYSYHGSWPLERHFIYPFHVPPAIRLTSFLFDTLILSLRGSHTPYISLK